MNHVAGSIYHFHEPILCKGCKSDCTAAFASEVQSATGAVANAYGNGLSEAIAYLQKLEATILYRTFAID